MRLPVALALALTLGLSACDARRAQDVSIENAWIRMPAVAGRPGAAYFTIRGVGSTGKGGGGTAILENIVSPQIERIELHDATMDGGVMRMRPLQDRSIAPGAELKFEPGGKHAMLFGMTDQITPGGHVPLHFRFVDGREFKIVANVRSAGEGAPDHAAH